MKLTKTLIILISFFFCQDLLSQINPDKIIYADGKYMYQGRIYKRSQLKPIIKELKKDETLSKQVYRYNRAKAGKILYGTLAAGIFSTIAYRWAFDDKLYNNCRDSDDGCALLYAQILGASAIVGIALIPYSSLSKATKKELHKTFEMYNEGVIDQPKIGMTPLQLSVRVTPSGMGLVLNF